jgi:hypothetical protein
MNDSWNDLYATISADLGIQKFLGENDMEFHFRLVYSALGSWVLKLATDRDMDHKDLKQVSRAHVTNSVIDILNAFLSLDSLLEVYFKKRKPRDDEKWKLSLIRYIEDCYENLGYYDFFADYYIHETSDAKYLSVIDNHILNVDNSSDCEFMVGLGRYVAKTKECIYDFMDFFPGTANAKSAFETIVNYVSYQKFIKDYPGQLEIYDIDKRMWSSFDMKIALKYPLSMLRVDNLTYAILKSENGNLYMGKLPEIYNKTCKDSYFSREIWRLICGMASYLGKPFHVKIKHHFKNGIIIDFRNLNIISLPKRERIMLRAMTWPYRSCLDDLTLITYEKFRPAIEKIFNRLCIEVQGEEK